MVTNGSMSSLTGTKPLPTKNKKEAPEAGLKDVVKCVINVCNNGVHRKKEDRNQVNDNEIY